MKMVTYHRQDCMQHKEVEEEETEEKDKKNEKDEGKKAGQKISY